MLAGAAPFGGADWDRAWTGNESREIVAKKFDNVSKREELAEFANGKDYPVWSIPL
jgi:hypothetical protein